MTFDKFIADEKPYNGESELPLYTAGQMRSAYNEGFVQGHDRAMERFGIKDAGVWHYPKDGELPEEEELLLIAIKTPDGTEYHIAYYNKTLGFYLYTGHVDSDWDDVIGNGVLAWQYLPEQPKESN